MPGRIRVPFALPLLTLLLTLTPAGSPQAAAQVKPEANATPPTEFSEELSVSEVLLDVLVTDRSGTAIVGLDAEDFVVEEDGRPVELTGVTFYSTSRFVGGEAEADSLRVDRNPVDRYFILFFHDPPGVQVDITRRTSQQLQAGRQAKRWIREEALPTDWIAVVSYDVKLKIHQDFTPDRGALVKAVQGAVSRKDPSKNDWPSRRAEDAESAAGAPSLTAGLPAGKELRRETGTVYDGIRLLSQAAGGVVGRKNLVLFSTGFGDINTFGLYEPDSRYYEPMRRALNDNNLAVYTLDLTPPQVNHTMSHALNQLAGDTGGRYFFNFISFISPLRQLTEINNGYYLLSYQSRHPATDSGYQRVRVRTANPRFKVEAREGYLFGESPG